MKIGAVAERSGVSSKTIRFWESVGLLPVPRRTAAGYRDYEQAILARLAFIRQAQGAGFSLSRIQRVLDIGDGGEPACEHVGQLIEARLRDVEARIVELRATRRHLQTLAKRSAAQDPAECSGYCSILASS